LQPATFVSVPAVDLQHAGEQGDELPACHVVEADHTAGQLSEFTRAAVTHNLVAVADFLDRYIEQRYQLARRTAADTVAVTPGNQSQAALLQQARCFALNR